VLAACHVELSSGKGCRVTLSPQIHTHDLGITQYTDDAVMAKRMVSASEVSGSTMVRAAGFTYGVNRLGVALVLNSEHPISRDNESRYVADLAANIPVAF
jgi:hypothetical protein